MRIIGEDIWASEGAIKMPLGIEMTIRSTVIRLPDRSLMVISPIRPTPDWIAELKQTGPVKYIVAPNGMHHLYLAKFASHFPDAEIWGPADLIDKCKEVKFTGALSTKETLPWASAAEMVSVKARPPMFEEFVFFHVKTKTLILTDIMFNFHHFGNWLQALIARVNGGYKKLAMTRLGRSVFRDKQGLRALAAKIHAWQPRNLVVAHGDMIVGNAAEQLREPLQAWV
jgi:hypothetical protein